MDGTSPLPSLAQTKSSILRYVALLYLSAFVGVFGTSYFIFYLMDFPLPHIWAALYVTFIGMQALLYSMQELETIHTDLHPFPMRDVFDQKGTIALQNQFDRLLEQEKMRNIDLWILPWKSVNCGSITNNRRAIVWITRGVLQQLNPAQMRAILARELGALKSGLGVARFAVYTLFSALMVLTTTGWSMLRMVRSTPKNPGHPAFIIGALFLLIGLLSLPWAVLTLMVWCGHSDIWHDIYAVALCPNAQHLSTAMEISSASSVQESYCQWCDIFMWRPTHAPFIQEQQRLLYLKKPPWRLRIKRTDYYFE